MEEKIYKNAKIVVVDDVEEVLSSTKNCLEFEEMEVICFQNTIEGLEYLKNNKADVLLLDYFMPQMNGDKFVTELRKYNKETIIILQTGYSDKIPPLEMIDKMNIQGYLDKVKGEDELVLMTKAAVKTSFLNKEIRKKDKEIAILSYKKALIGDLISHLVNESRDQLFQIAGMANAIKEDTDDYNEETRIIGQATEKINSLYDALNFEGQKTMNLKQLSNTLRELLKAKMILNNIKLNIEYEDETLIINYANEIIYILLKIVDMLVKKEGKEIYIKIRENDGKIVFVLENTKGLIEIDELQMFVEDSSIKLIVENDNIIIKE